MRLVCESKLSLETEERGRGALRLLGAPSPRFFLVGQTPRLRMRACLSQQQPPKQGIQAGARPRRALGAHTHRRAALAQRFWSVRLHTPPPSAVARLKLCVMRDEHTKSGEAWWAEPGFGCARASARELAAAAAHHSCRRRRAGRPLPAVAAASLNAAMSFSGFSGVMLYG